jgi:hypothetical protein
MIEEKTRLPNRAPLSIRPAFIGKLIEMQKPHKGNPPIFERLCIAVKQCRNYNAGSQEELERLLPHMVRTQQELARLGVVVG